VVLDSIYGFASAVNVHGYGGTGVIAWTSAAGGAGFAAAGGGIVQGGDLIADSPGDAPDAGVVALGSSVGVYGNYPLGNGFTDFTLTSHGPANSPSVDVNGYDDQEFATGSEIAAVPSGPNYIVVLVGSSVYAGSCSSDDGSGFSINEGSLANLSANTWPSSGFLPISCNALGATLASGGGAGIGLLEDEGIGGSSNGIYYRPFSTTSRSFGAAVPISNEASNALVTADSLSSSEDANDGVYAAWTDERGAMFDYSANGGSSWVTPVVTGVSNAANAVIAAVNFGTAEMAYSSSDVEELTPVSAG
jgi:hypothetical protein